MGARETLVARLGWSFSMQPPAFACSGPARRFEELATTDTRLKHLRAAQASIKFTSFEPLLGAVGKLDLPPKALGYRLGSVVKPFQGLVVAGFCSLAHNSATKGAGD
jgi:hypothetical protein